MNTEVTSLSADEKAYFDTRGEVEVKDTPAPQVSEEPSKPEPEAVEVDVDAELAETDVADDTEAPEKPTGQSKVPLAALTKERAKAKAEAERRIEAEKKAAILEDRWNMVLASQQQQEQPAQVEEIPDPAVDPQGALNWAIQQAKDAREKQAAEAQKTEEQRRADAEWQETYRAVNEDYTASVAAEPTIKTAHEYLLNSQGEEFMAMGMSREEAQQEISRIEAQHIAFAKRTGKQIGPYIMGLAKARGFRAEAAKPAADPASEIDRLNEAVAGSTSLSDGGGAAPAVTNAQSIADMSPEKFAEWIGKPGNAAKFKRLAGG
jgi:hypothetical protein